MTIFGSSLRNNQIKNIHQNTPFLKIFSKVHTPEPLCHTIYTLLKNICTLLLNPVMYMCMRMCRFLNENKFPL